MKKMHRIYNDENELQRPDCQTNSCTFEKRFSPSFAFLSAKVHFKSHERKRNAVKLKNEIRRTVNPDSKREGRSGRSNGRR